METKTVTVLVFNNLNELFEATKGHQLTAQEIVNGRSYINGNWQNFELANDGKANIMDLITETLGGHKKTKESIFNSLMWARPQHWGLSRVFFRNYDGKILCSYCAGQDHTWELNQIRKAIK
jgi:hypothetical protein